MIALYLIAFMLTGIGLWWCSGQRTYGTLFLTILFSAFWPVTWFSLLVWGIVHLWIVFADEKVFWEKDN
jgi:hypothetical protein